jgi:uncharacterized protein (DUF4415 family)
MIFDRIDELKTGIEKKKHGRGLGKKPALVHLSLRLPKDVMDFFDSRYPYAKQAKIREILTDYVNKELTNEK